MNNSGYFPRPSITSRDAKWTALWRGIILFCILLVIALMPGHLAISQQNSQTMTNADVIALTTAGISEDIIAAKVRSMPANSFDTSVNGLKALQAAHVSSVVINAMINPQTPPAQPAYASSYTTAMANASSNDPLLVHPPGIYMYTGSGQSARLTKMDAATFRQAKGKNVGLSGFTYGIVKYKLLTVIEHPTSPVETADSNPAFYLYSPPDDYSFRGSSVHVADFVLVKLNQKADSREMQSGTGSPWGHSVGTDDKARRGFSYVESSPGIYKLTLVEPLPPGQYAFSPNKTTLYDFGIGATSGNSANAPTEPAKPDAAAPPSSSWKLKPVEHPQAITDVYEATLNGTSEADGKRGAAQIDVSCTANRFTGSAGTDASTSAILKVRREMVAFPTDSLSCQGDGASGAPFLRSQLGTGEEQTRNLCFDEELGTDTRAVMSFGLSYEEPLVAAILQASGEPLTLKVRPQDGGPDALTATFQLPTNGSEVLAAFEPCLKVEEAKRKKEADAVVVACPELPDRTLSDVSVLVGTAMRKLPKDPENDIGAAWDMPKATKAHPSLPKLTLACSYQDGGKPTTTSAAPSTKAVSASTERKLLPIPTTAKFCVFREDPYTNAPYGNCSRE